MSDLACYAVAAMSPGEIAWRARRTSNAVRRYGWREQTDFRMLRTSLPNWDTLLQRFREGTARPVLLDQDRARRIAAERPADVKLLLAQAEHFLVGEHAYLGYPSATIGGSKS